MLNYNETCHRKKAETKLGEKRYQKYKKGGHIVCKLTKECTYGKAFYFCFSLHTCLIFIFSDLYYIRLL